MRKQKFNDNWIFRTGGGSSLEALAGGDRAGKMVTLPHDASIGNERNQEESNGRGNGILRAEHYKYKQEYD